MSARTDTEARCSGSGRIHINSMDPRQVDDAVAGGEGQGCRQIATATFANRHHAQRRDLSRTAWQRRWDAL
jgi:hypothetical protein